MTTPKLDIFRVLSAISSKQRTFYQNLSEDEQKAFQPFLVQRWLSGTPRASDVVLLNELANYAMFPLQRHKQLLYQLLVAVNSGDRQRYVWNKLPTKNTTGKPNAIRCVVEYLNYNTSQAVEALQLLDRDAVVSMAEQLGWQPDEIAKVKKELKASDGQPSKASKTSTPNDLLEF